MSDVNLENVGVAAACDVKGVFVLLNVDKSGFAAAAAHGVENSAVLERH